MIKSWYDEVKEDFVKNINDTYTLNLAVSILEDRQNLLEENQKYKEVIEKVINKLETDIEFCKNDSQGVYDLCNIAIAREKKILDILKEVEHE